MVKSNILLVDGDARNLRVLEVSLRKTGYLVTTAVNGLDALEKVSTAKPDLIISDTHLPELDGFSFCERIKQSPPWSHIPFIFLTNQRSMEDKIRSLELGVEEILTKPIFVKEIVSRIRMLLQKHQRESLVKKDIRTPFSSSLADMAVIDLIQTLELGRKSCIVHLHNDQEHQGSIYLRNGQIIDAELGRLKGEMAVYRLLGWNEGVFEVEFTTVEREDVIQRSNQILLMEGMRRIDEWGRLLEQLPPLNTIFEVDFVELANRLGEIPDEVNSLLRLFDGRRSLLAVVDDCRYGDLEALDVICKLFFEGIIYDAATGPHRVSPAETGPMEEYSSPEAPPPPQLPSNVTPLMTIRPDPFSAALDKVNDIDLAAAQAHSPITFMVPEDIISAAIAPPTLDSPMAVPDHSSQKPAEEQIISALTAHLNVPSDASIVTPDSSPVIEMPSSVHQISDPLPDEAKVIVEDYQMVEEHPHTVPVVAKSINVSRAKVTAVWEPLNHSLSDQSTESDISLADAIVMSATAIESASASSSIEVTSNSSLTASPELSSTEEQNTHQLAVSPVQSDEAQELDQWLAEDPQKVSDPADSRGHIILFPATASRTSPNDEQQPPKNKPAAEENTPPPQDQVNLAASTAAQGAGKHDPCEASINVHDEQFFATDFLEDHLLEDEFYEAPKIFTRGKKIGLGVLFVALISGGIMLYAYQTSPYVGDGPAELQIKRAASVQKNSAKTAAQTKQQIAARHQEEENFLLGGKRQQASAGQNQLPASQIQTAQANSAALDNPETTGVGNKVTAADAGGDPKISTNGTTSPTVIASKNTSTEAATRTPTSKQEGKETTPAPKAGSTTEGAALESPKAEATSDYQALLKQAQEFLKKKNKRQAYKMFAKAVEANPQGWEALQELALYHMELGQMAKASDFAQKAKAANEQAPYVPLVMGAALYERGKLAEAKKAYEQFLNLCPTCRYANDVRLALKSM